MKKILLLGGSRYIIPVIEEIHKMGHYAITCDYLPVNDAHKYSDEYHNISIIDKESVLNLAKELKIDGIMSFACDPGVATAAYVAEKMNLPFQGSYESVSIMQDKELFRKFLTDNNFNVPHAKGYIKKEEAMNDINYFEWPVIVKPVDSAGSKGVTKVEKPEDLEEAIEFAISNSHCERFIIEDFLTFEGYHSSADCFTVNGELRFVTYSDQLFDKDAENPYTPAYIIWPSTMKNEDQEYLTKETQRFMSLLNMKNGIYNIETCVANNGKPYIMEVSPRGGGCKIAEIQYLASDINLIRNEIKSAIGEKLDNIENPIFNGVWCEMVVHSDNEKTGVFDSLWIDEEMKEKHVKVIDLQVKEGDIVEPFTGANKSLGDIFLRFETREELDKALAQKEDWLKILLK